MQAFIRGPRPVPLDNDERRQRWTDEWVNNGGEFSWHGSRQAIVQAASRDTADHCSYCDQHLPDPKTVDHFRPKARESGFPQLAYEWTNLYLCCAGCQPRVGPFTDEVIAPDETEYAFDAFFTINPESFEIEALPGPNEVRARKTIEHLGLNKQGRSLGAKRKKSLRTESNLPFAERNYRFLWGAPEGDLL